VGKAIQSRGAELVNTVLSSAVSVINVVMLFVIVPVVAVYLLLIPDPAAMLVTSEWPAPAVATWKAVAELFRDGIEAALFYTVIYVIMAAGAFGIVILLGREGYDADELDDLRGLNQRSPWFAAIMLLIMVSMIGVPPLAGFYAKWWVLSALLDAGKLWLAVAGIVFSVIGAFYYIRIVYYMYFGQSDEPVETVMGPSQWAVLMGSAAIMVAGVVNLFGIEAVAAAAAQTLLR